MIVQGDARTLPLVDACVQCVVTSPPYFGLRDYGTATWVGGDPACDHLQKVGGTLSSTLGLASGGHDMSDEARVRSTTRSFVPYRDICGTCGARRIDQQIGLEPSPDAYVAALVGVYREVWRVLKDDGVIFLNLGDSYAGGGRGGNPESSPFQKQRSNRGSLVPKTPIANWLKPKDLIGIPWRVAFALQADGWYLRSDIIWSKPNPMPESVTDRPTKAHEYVFLLTKRERYYFDAEAVREPSCDTGGNGTFVGRQGGARSTAINGGVGTATLHPYGVGRNIRSVWSIATQPYAGAHFATMPEALVERCVRAGSRPGDRVLDPFAGSGTVGRVAWELNRRPVLIDLNPSYLALATNRTGQIQRSLLDVT